MGKIKKLGSLYFEGNPVIPGAIFAGQELSIGDTCPGVELQWVDDGGLLVSDRTICTNITWEQLDQKGLVFGAPVRIDGKSYLCRCLKVGSKEGVPNEWDALLDKYGENDNLWHWEYQRFWGQETISRPDLPHPIRGGVLARFWCWDRATYQSVDVGFRPVLEPLLSGGPEVLVGRNIKVFGPREEYIRGRLVEFSDYDLMVDPAAGIGDGIGWTHRQNGMVIIERGAITKIWEVEP